MLRGKRADPNCPSCGGEGWLVTEDTAYECAEEIVKLVRETQEESGRAVNSMEAGVVTVCRKRGQQGSKLHLRAHP